MEQEHNLKQQRYQKIDDLRKNGIEPYPTNWKPDDKTNLIHEQYQNFTKEDLEEKDIQVKIAGRITAIRDFGKASFLQLKDGFGSIQIYVKKATIGDLYQYIDVGDFWGVEGSIFRTKTNELTVRGQTITLLSKSIAMLPEKFHGLTDIETRYRQRYVDLIMNQEVKEIFQTRSKIIQEIRNYLIQKDYLEVETPMLQSIAGGAIARPFITYHNTYHQDLYLRIAPELYLKRLIVGGFEKVFEINRNFRNEGISPNHNPEFTMLEFYQAYTNYHELMDLTEDLLRLLCRQITGKEEISYQGITIDFSKPFPRVTILELLKKYENYTDDQLQSRDFLIQKLQEKKIKILDSFSIPKLQFLLFEEEIEKQLIQPTFVIDHPLDVSPLAKKHHDNPEQVERFELYIAGREIANAFNELNDPVEQKQRFVNQMQDREAGDQEAHQMDEDYINALEYGMPPTAGEGIGIDRLVMIFTNSSSIREVILFPLLRK